MPRDSDFIAVAASTPLNDPVRLVYADWLEEQGDPRGEFIRLQIQLTQVG